VKALPGLASGGGEGGKRGRAPDAGVEALDRPQILARLFHPRPEWGPPPEGAEDLRVPVAEGVTLGARFRPSAPGAPTLLFFHGNGEVAADYDDLGPVFAGAGWNFLAVDYRGYGRSTGRPTATALLADAHGVFRWVRQWLAERGYPGPVAVCGRSLGSAPALELAASLGHPEVAGLVVESGFAELLPLLEVLGLDPEGLGLTEEHGFGNLEKIRQYRGPTLIIHGERDHLIPIGQGRALFAASEARDKRLLVIPGADHNSLFAYGLEPYARALADLGRTLRGPG